MRGKKRRTVVDAIETETGRGRRLSATEVLRGK